ncbi:hypothetical protein OPIT5_19605 [Opitutaceae bacterium TAV5]|nr:hypothetical protein OPIT5_19605 [Opitutaceae bacterium TAV5]
MIFLIMSCRSLLIPSKEMIQFIIWRQHMHQ